MDNTHLFATFNAKECAVYLQYKKLKTDGAMPKELAERRQLCKEWMGCQSPTSSSWQSDDEDDGDQGDRLDRNDVVEASLGMAGLNTYQDDVEHGSNGSVAEM